MRFTIGKKLGLGFGVILFLMVINSAVAYIKVKNMEASVDMVVSQAFPTKLACGELLNGINHSLSALRGYLILGSDPENARKFKADRADGWKEIDSALADMDGFGEHFTSAQDRKYLRTISSTVEEFRAAQKGIETIAQTSGNVPAYQLLLDEASPRAAKIEAAFTKIIDGEQLQEVTAERNRLLKNLADIRASFALAMASIRTYLLSGDKDHNVGFQEHWKDYQAAHQLINASVALFSESQKREWEAYTGLHTEYDPLPQKMFDLRSAANWNQANFELATEAAPRAQKMIEALRAIRDSANQRVDLARKDMEAAARELTRTLILVTLVAIGIGLAVALMLSQKIATAVQAVVERATAIANGHLTGSALAITTQDEIGQLAEVFNVMLDSLKDQVGQMRSAAENLNGASAEILSSTQEQASSTAEQASTVQEITSTIEEINQSGAQISDKAKAVATSAEATSTASQAGLQAVAKGNRAMESIREQVEEVAETIVSLSEKTLAVGEIISTVNDIAERSNLLALNAAIEATSAGAEGNRFAVVANEMKNLADQAKEATVQVRNILSEIQKGINTSVMLIEEAVKRVESGKQQAELTEQTIRQMGSTTDESVQAFQQIIGATGQQRIVMEQVTQGMKAIRQASGQTAAGTSQLQQAVASLNALSQQLSGLVGRYKV